MAVPTPRSCVDVDPNFERQLRNLKTLFAAQEQPLREGGQVKWMRPLGWSGDPTDFSAIHAALNRDQANQQYIQAVQDARQPGVAGDLIAATVMIDYLATAERALLNRITMNRCRRQAHAAGRARGHGSDRGVFVQSGIEYIRRIVARSRGTS